MPPIPRFYLECSAYLYPSEQAARDGEGVGGSGFLVNVPVEGHEGWGSLYVITNKHVLDKGGRFLRLSTGNGIDVLETERGSWIDHRNRYDVSALSLDIEGKQFKYSSVSTEKFITREIIDDWDIAPGDETFLVGRLITPWGQQRNKPAVRFGNISMLADPDEPIIGWDNVEQEAFLVECRSLSGFSGSAVFVSTTRWYDADTAPQSMRQPQPQSGQGLIAKFVAASGTFGPWLLGIDMSHLPLWKSVYEADEKTDTTYRVEQNTGIACVLPAWHILDLLDEEEFVKERKKDKEALDKRKKQSAVVDVAEQPLTKAGFEETLRKVSAKVSKPESEKKYKP